MSSRAERFANCKHEKVQDFTEICLKCGESIYTTVAEINLEEHRKDRKKREGETFDKDNTGW